MVLELIDVVADSWPLVVDTISEVEMVMLVEEDSKEELIEAVEDSIIMSKEVEL